MFHAIIFDFDGVLVDSVAGYVKAVQHVLQSNGIKTTDEELKTHLGEDMVQVFVGYASKAGRVEDAPKLTAEFHRIVSESGFNSGIRLFDGASEVLAELKKRGFLLALASGTHNHFLKQFADALKITGYFNVILGSEDVKNCKPDPEIVQKAAELLGVKPEEALYVGDAKNDVMAAKAANVACAIVLTGALSKEAAEALSPDYILKDLGEILGILDNCGL